MNAREKFIANYLKEIWNKKSRDKSNFIYGHFSPYLVVNSPIGKSIGPSQLREINSQWLNAFPDMKISNLHIVSHGNFVIAHWISQGRHQRLFRGVNATGKCVRYPGDTLFHFQGEKIVRYSCRVDMGNVYSQLGSYLKEEEYDRQAILHRCKEILIKRVLDVTHASLTGREIDCICLNLSGLCVKQIALVLSISPRTVETHLHRTYHEFSCYSKLDCLEKMIDMHLLPLWHDLGKIIMREYETRQKSLPSS